MKFEDIYKYLPEDASIEFEVFFGTWDSGSIEFTNDSKYGYLIKTISQMLVVGISVSFDSLQVVLV